MIDEYRSKRGEWQIVVNYFYYKRACHIMKRTSSRS